MLADPTDAERSTLGVFRYSRNPTLLHSDTTLLPRARGARASWNYLMPSCAADADRVTVSYDMNRLQRLDAPDTYVVTLNGADRVDPETVRARMVYEHPVYTPESVAAQARLHTLSGPCHRLRGGVPRLGLPRGRLPFGGRGSRRPGGEVVSALYPCTITHLRNRPTKYALRHRTYLWLIDPDRPPRLPRALRPLARFDARDHFGGTAPTIRDRARPIPAGGAWSWATAPSPCSPRPGCSGTSSTRSPSTGATAPTAVPLRRRRGAQHVRRTARLSPASRRETDRAVTGKEFYVSPFFPVDGGYRMRLPSPGPGST